MAINFSKEDKEKLKENTSALYQKRTEESNKEDIKNLSVRGKIRQFRDYYLKAVIVGVLVLALVGVGIYQNMTKKSIALYVVIQNDALDEEKVDAFEEALAKYLQIDTSRERVLVDTNCNDQKLQGYLYAETVDVVIIDEEHFKDWGSAQYFYDVETGNYVKFYQDYPEEDLFRTKYITGEDVLNNKETKKTKASDQKEYSCGLYVSDSQELKALGSGLKKPVIAMSAATKHYQEAKEFIQIMKDNDIELDFGQNK